MRPAPDLQALAGGMAIGHVRYATTGPSAWHNAQPVSRQAVFFALGHNGNLVNTAGRAAGRAAGRDDIAADSESDVTAALIADALPAASGDLAAAVLPLLQGAYSLVIMDETRLIGARDPHGFRPLFLGQLETGGWVLASETPALDVVGARVTREIAPGGLVVIDDAGVRSIQFAAPRPRALCSFEFVYIARPDGHLAGIGCTPPATAWARPWPGRPTPPRTWSCPSRTPPSLGRKAKRRPPGSSTETG